MNKKEALKILNHTEFSSKFILDEAVSGDYILKKLKNMYFHD